MKILKNKIKNAKKYMRGSGSSYGMDVDTINFMPEINKNILDKNGLLKDSDVKKIMNNINTSSKRLSKRKNYNG
ncbi:MAG: hypothetical protein WC343_03740 [Bacilli bacterium]